MGTCANELGVRYEEAALKEILPQARSYPDCLQEWGKPSWQGAIQSPVTRENAVYTTDVAILKKRVMPELS